MSTIPLDLERSFERRWAARFFPPAASAAPKGRRLEGQGQKLAAASKGKGKPGGLNRRAEPAGS
jgi:hypothetical protein